MKKIAYLLLIPFLSIPVLLKDTNLVLADEAPVVLSDEQKDALLNQIKSPIRFTTSATTYEGYDLVIVDEVDETNRYTGIYYQDILLNEQYFVSDENDYAYNLKINISNTSELTPLYETNNEEEPLTFSSYFGSPFRRLSNKEIENIENYFEISTIWKGYKLEAKDNFYGLINHDFNNFFYLLNDFVWDETTFNLTIKKLIITLDEKGEMTKMSFTRLCRDKFGSVNEQFSIDVESISNVNIITGVEQKMSDEQEAIFLDKINNFQNKINVGNFTQHYATTYDRGFEYNTYFVFDSLDPVVPSMMITDLMFEDPTYGVTFMGAYPLAGAYYPYAFSPDTLFMDRYVSLVFESFNELLPNFLKISSDFFEYKNGKYILNFQSLSVVDNAFSVAILNALFTPIDPLANLTTTYIDMSMYDYNFDTLEISFDINGNVNAKLNFYSLGKKYSTSITFLNFGTTSLYDVPQLEGVIDLLRNA